MFSSKNWKCLFLSVSNNTRASRNVGTCDLNEEGRGRHERCGAVQGASLGPEVDGHLAQRESDPIEGREHAVEERSPARGRHVTREKDQKKDATPSVPPRFEASGPRFVSVTSRQPACHAVASVKEEQPRDQTELERLALLILSAVHREGRPVGGRPVSPQLVVAHHKEENGRLPRGAAVMGSPRAVRAPSSLQRRPRARHGNIEVHGY